MLRYLLDTNVLSEPIAEKPNRSVMARLAKHGLECATAAPVLHELRFGCKLLPPSKRRADIESYLENVVLSVYEVLPYDQEAAEWHAGERARLSTIGRTPPFVDGVIAAIASVRGLVLVTANAKDFRGFKGLTVESWQK